MRPIISMTGLALALSLVLFALPRLPLHADGTALLFAVGWLFFAFLVLAAHLYQVIWLNEQARERERQRKQMIQWRRWQKMQQAHKRQKVFR